MRVALVAGTRPNFVKIAPVHDALAARPGFEPVVVHTGQHYDAALSATFFEQLGIPEPVANFGVGSGSPARQVADVMVAFAGWIEGWRPDAVVVVGDVNSTLACALVAAQAHLPLAHVEAGLRSGDRSMPEEINRILVDAVSDVLLASEESGVDNLLREGVPSERVHLVGNVMIDSLLRHREAARGSDVRRRLGLPAGPHALATLHRPGNVDEPRRLRGLLDALGRVAADLPVVLSAHPRTRQRLAELGAGEGLRASGVVVTDPLPYLDFLELMATAAVVLTDSGGVQEETTALGAPCLTLRENTERPSTVTNGTNVVVGTEPTRIVEAWRRIRDGGARRTARGPACWDGHAAERVADVLERAWPAKVTPGSEPR